MSEEETIRINIDAPKIAHKKLKERQANRRKQGLPFLTISQLAKLALLESLMRDEMESTHEPF